MPIVGIDVSKQKLHCSWLRDPDTGKVRNKTVANTPKGFETLLEWAQRQIQVSIDELHFVMEATGIYHEALAEALHAAGAKVSVVNPLHVKRFAESQGVVTKNDLHDAQVVARFGLERRPALWTPVPAEIKHLKALLARRDALDKDIQREHNRREKAQILGTPQIIDSIDTVLKALTAERNRLDKDINDHIDGHPQLKQDRRLLETIPGIGDKLSSRFVALFRDKPFTQATQAAAYLGLAVVEHQSGTSVQRRPHISKIGDARFRSALYMPAIAACRFNPDVRALYQRLIANGKSKMAALIAAMRKLVHIAFGVFKHQTQYQPQHA